MNLFKYLFKKFRKRNSDDIKGTVDNSNFNIVKNLLPTVKFEPLYREENSYITTRKVAFKKVRDLKDETIDRVFDFAYTMAFDEKHRKTRSGGRTRRRNGEVFANTFQGKLAECAAVNFFYKYDDAIEIDFDTYDLGIWDKVDLTVRKKEIAIKSTKKFGQLLLLETKDWNSSGQYIPNLGTHNNTYDYIVMVRIDPSCEDLMKKNRLLYKEEIEQSVLKNLVTHQSWSYDYVGYITNDDLIQVIRNKHIIPQGALLNGSTPMDAENYYVQAGDMRKLIDFDKIFQKL